MTRSAAATHLLPSKAGRTASRPDVVGSGGPGGEPIPLGPDAIAWAARALRHNDLPPEEIGAVLGAEKPELVRRYMELHRERLEERLADQLRALANLERFLVEAMFDPPEGTEGTRTAIHELEGDDPAGLPPDPP